MDILQNVERWRSPKTAKLEKYNYQLYCLFWISWDNFKNKAYVLHSELKHNHQCRKQASQKIKLKSDQLKW